MRNGGITSEHGGIILAMILRILGWLGASSGVGALLYWQVVLAEGAYLGPRAVRCIYQLGAQRYDAVRQPWQQSADAILLPHLHAALANRNAPRILDVATGTGRVPRLLCADPSFHGVVTALDLTPAMLAQARRKAPALPVLWLQAEANALPGTAASVDLVTCLEALEYFPQPRQALHEMVRVLRPGGTLLLSKVPDNWARLLPGRALQRSQLAQTLHDLGCADVHFAPWQDGHYELVWAKRR
ncbi:MAG: class I SAM-dependent methyltransferase [Candidatus Viridilinea halotolerans]|uniref:Class I SAM-dependent methyltransferase n=1 Tax=Candidatus Viridilinea halotolerans TaxID=2491704 RepID=A0A426U472_9CHLR|nr:MAG: class I SAM-dependent methyltransferase [Candidatus Viridilinea halotolerans]